MLRVWALFLAELSAQMPASPFGHKENVPKMPAGALISPSLSAVDGLRYAARYAQLHRPQLSAEGRRVLLQDTLCSQLAGIRRWLVYSWYCRPCTRSRPSHFTL